MIASSLARLIRKERGSRPVIEAHYATSEGRNGHVLFDNGRCELVLITRGPDGAIEEERTEVPARQGKFLVDVSAGTIGYNRVRLDLGSQALSVNCFTTPAPLAIAELDFDSPQQAEAFKPPLWFGPEVTSDAAYDRHSIAINGIPAAPEVPVANSSLHSLLDTLERGAKRPVESALEPAEQPASRLPRPVSANGGQMPVSEAATHP